MWLMIGIMLGMQSTLLLMALGAVASFSVAGDKYNQSTWATALGILVVNIIASIIWLGFGTVIGHLRHSKKTWLSLTSPWAADRGLRVADLALRMCYGRKLFSRRRFYWAGPSG